MRASYREAVAWVALNDSAADDDALDEVAVSELVTTALVADIFRKDRLKVARAIVRFREKDAKAEKA